MSSELADDGHEIDEFGLVIGIGAISVADLLYRATEELDDGPPGAALARIARARPDGAESRLLALRYIAAARALDDVARSEIAQVLGEQRLIAVLTTFVTAAWAELGHDADHVLASLTRSALIDICGSAGDG